MNMKKEAQSTNPAMVEGNAGADQIETPGAGAAARQSDQPTVGPGGGGAMNNMEAKTVTLPTGEFEELKTKAAKANEYWDRLLRQTADFDNYKKRMARERQEATRYATEALIEKLIPVIDNFEMALAAANNPQATSVEALRSGIALIYNQLKAVLTDAGLEEIEATNKGFDPNWQEAVSEQETSDAPEGQVLQQVRKGYKLRDRLIRPAAVVVAKNPAA